MRNSICSHVSLFLFQYCAVSQLKLTFLKFSKFFIILYSSNGFVLQTTDHGAWIVLKTQEKFYLVSNIAELFENKMVPFNIYKQNSFKFHVHFYTESRLFSRQYEEPLGVSVVSVFSCTSKQIRSA